MPTSLVLFLLLVQPFGSAPQSAAPPGSPDLQAKLHIRVKNYALSADSFLGALVEVATQFEIPVGIEWSKNDETMRKVSLAWTDADVRQVIQELVDTQHEYEFDVADSVVHIFPKWAKSSQQDFTNLVLQKFDVRNELLGQANHRLRQLVKFTVSPPPQTGATVGGTGGSQLGSVGEPKISLKLENIMVRDALDQVALNSDHRIWVVTFTDESGVTPTGFRRTRTLWNNSVVPDNEQPVWDTFRWGETIPARKE
jgi:hypothetical protein